MNEPLDELEAELRALRPVRPSPGLGERLGRVLGHVPGHVPGAAAGEPEGPCRAEPSRASLMKGGVYFLGVPLATAAALWIAMVHRGAQPRDGADAPAAVPSGAPRAAADLAGRPDRAVDVLYAVRDEGPVPAEGRAPADRVRFSYVDTYTWQNPATNASLSWSVPRDEIHVVPVRFE